MYQNGLFIGDKHAYECSKPGCEFSARIILLHKPDSKPSVDASGNFKAFTCKLYRTI